MWRNRSFIVLKASFVLAFFVVLAVLLPGCASTSEQTPESASDLVSFRFSTIQLSGAQGETVWALQRGPAAPPLRYQVVVIPGSGCAGMGAIADRYFGGLLHAQVTVLHKPGVHPADTTPPHKCSRQFVESDSLSWWTQHARAALHQLAEMQDIGSPSIPWLLVGISEGAELLPFLADAAMPGPAGMVMISSSGLDPQDVGRMQAERRGHLSDWEMLARAQAGSGSDTLVLQGRSLRYWRDLWQWQIRRPLLQGSSPLLQAWGDADDLVPQGAFMQFAAETRFHSLPFCSLLISGADHGLQNKRTGVNGLLQVWAQVEAFVKYKQGSFCEK